ncbi:site-specific DNA-methyltransferase [Mycobacteroides abscessus]|uniref:DNA-methyltransferase n=1 Tax=Mycobacteroides abscessus TaxID=36809 RepID=UPI000E690FE3|nr:site-specific DNA-methyltransferase [Mycobacteroides abscessus]RIU22649.1 site-specific DNA-methyltransferase [Mycobacteroides abscessus]
MKPYYQDELVTLYHGDCLEILPSISGVDLVVTSPPYNLGTSPGGAFGHYGPGQSRGGNKKWKGVGSSGIGYRNHDDSMPAEDYQRWQQDCLSAMWRTLTEVGAIFYNHKPRVQRDGLWTPLVLNPGLPVRQIVTWARSGGFNFSTTNYVPTYEWIIIFAKTEMRLISRQASGIGDVWRFHQEPNALHPAPFPIALPNTAISTTAPSLVLDPLAGSGTTLRAAKNAGVRSIGIEKSEHYCEVIANRLAQGVLDFMEGA